MDKNNKNEASISLPPLVDLRKCRLVRMSDPTFETLFYDDKPILEIYPVEIEQELKDDGFIVRLTQKIRRCIS